MSLYAISFVGAGRVGNALCRELFKAGHSIDIIASLTEDNGHKLADSCHARWSSDLIFPVTTRVIIVAVPDHAIEVVLEKIKCQPGTLIVHTAGSVGLEVFPKNLKNKGIFYPMQTFTKGRNPGFENLPFLLESDDKESSAVMKNIAESIGGKVYFIDSELRTRLHLAAVFINNFTNYMLTLGKNVAADAGFEFDIFEPLITETIKKALAIGPENSQTGPAFRNDTNTIKKHLDLLSFSPERKKIYEELTQSIISYYNSKR